jgi:hypothetical protein
VATGSTDYIQKTQTQWYDRSPVTSGYVANLALGGAARSYTNDWVYANPANSGKRAFVQLVFAGIWNDSPTATNGVAYVEIVISPAGGAATISKRLVLPTGSATKGDTSHAGGTIVLNPGDAIRGYSYSANTAPGSNVLIIASAIITEFLM